MSTVLAVFLSLKVLTHFLELWLGKVNRRYYLDRGRQKDARKALGISQKDFDKTLKYAEDKYRYGVVAGTIHLVCLAVCLIVGCFGIVETASGLLVRHLVDAGSTSNEIWVGLFFVGIVGLALTVYGWPFAFYETFVIEQRHGFNKQSKRGFFADQAKGVVVGAIIGGPLIFGLLYVMDAAGSSWWIWAWGVLTVFSLVVSWLYPTVLAPLFNKFSPVEDGPLKKGIFDLAETVGFDASEVLVMDASTRSTHGNAYFTGVFGAKRIVLFDTLVKTLKESEIVAVLAHELGHFKLGHVKWALVRSSLMTGLMFYGISVCLPMESFYTAFGFAGVSNYGALTVFTMWFGLLDLVLRPLGSYLSRRNEFAADAFAKKHVRGEQDLIDALVKLRGANHSMPICHPLYSAVYHSHPPLPERFASLRHA